MFSAAEMPALLILLMLLQHLIDLTQGHLLGKGNTEQVGEGHCFKKRQLVSSGDNRSCYAGLKGKGTTIFHVSGLGGTGG